MRLIIYIRNLYSDKRYALLVMFVIIGAIALAIALTFSLIGLKVIISLISENFRSLMLILGVISLIVFWWKEKKRINMELLKQKEENAIYMIESAEQMIQENNYNTARMILFHTLKDVSDILRLNQPKRLEDLDLPEKNQRKNSYYINQFIVLKSGEIDPKEIKEILQIKIMQKLNSFDFPGITQNVINYDGKLYPVLMIDEVHDYGRYLHIDVVWVSERYCKLVNSRLIARHMELSNRANSIEDKDFR